MWSNEPWDNDEAADWFGNLHDQTKLRDFVAQTLESPSSSSCELRAATHIVSAHCQVYSWPIDHIKNDLRLAEIALKQVLRDDAYIYDEEIKGKVETELQSIQQRL